MTVILGAIIFAAGMVVGVIFHAALKTAEHKAGAVLQLAPNHTATVTPGGTVSVQPAPGTATPPKA